MSADYERKPAVEDLVSWRERHKVSRIILKVKGKRMSLVTLTTGKSVIITASPEDSGGNPVPLPAGQQLAWHCSDTNVASIAPAPDSLSCTVKGLTAGSVQVGANIGMVFQAMTVAVSAGGTITQIALTAGAPF